VYKKTRDRGEHDAWMAENTTLSRPHHQEPADAKVGSYYVGETAQESLDILIEQAREGKASAISYFQEQLQQGNLDIHSFLVDRAMQEDTVVVRFLQQYYQLLIQRLFAGQETVLTFFHRQLDEKNPIALLFLVDQAERGMSEAFEILQVYYWEEIRRYVRRMIGEREVSFDLLQDIFLKAWLSLPTRKQKEGLHIRAWLYKIAHSVINDYYRKENREKPLLSMERDLSDPFVQGPEQVICECDSIRQALEQVGPRSRTCLFMAYVEGYSTQEIASHLNITQSTVTAYISRAREQFRQAYTHLVEYKKHARGGEDHHE
jgi:RNA polymerase sigma-70 factor (ECF subfamily)